ncbi:MAG: glycosyl hydrolase family 18 protein [Bacteroidota bacterium]
MKKLLLLCIALLILSTWADAQTKPSASARKKFRVVGYYSLRSALNADPKTVPFDKMTHVNLSFLNPDTLGNFTQDLSGLAPFINAAHKQGVKVLPSIAGGGKHEYYHKLLRDDMRGKFVSDLVDITEKYNFDGIDVDIEGSDIDENYEVFVVELKKALKAKKKLTTSAIAIFYKNQLTDRALKQYDFVNLMSYDHTGPWTPGKPGPHSTYEHAVADLNYFTADRKIPRKKIVLGVGFYGYGFGPELTSKASSMNYGQILKTYPGAENSDQVNTPTGQIMYYNGAETMKKKVLLAKEKASGIMIWQVLGDAPGDQSLLKLINDVSYGK